MGHHLKLSTSILEAIKRLIKAHSFSQLIATVTISSYAEVMKIHYLLILAQYNPYWPDVEHTKATIKCICLHIKRLSKWI